MVQENIIISVKEEGTRVVKRRLNEVGRSAKSTQSQILNLRNTLIALGSIVVADPLVRLLDSYTALQNKLKQVTISEKNLKDVTTELFNISNKTRASIEATATAYARSAQAAKNYGLTQRQVLTFTENLNKVIATAGISANEASAGLYQFSQALQSGVLQGDELRSVLENIPPVARIIADEFETDIGKLRQLGSEGALVANRLFDAFLHATDQINSGFAKSTVTIGQSFTVLRNNIVRFFGELDNVTGASNILARSILLIANNIDFLTRALFIGATAWVAYRTKAGYTLIVTGIKSIIVVLSALRVAILANPIGLFASALALVGSSLYFFRKELRLTETSVNDFTETTGASFKAMASNIGNVFRGIIQVIKDAFNDAILIANEFAIYLKKILPESLGNILVTLNEDELKRIAMRTGRTVRESYDLGFYGNSGAGISVSFGGGAPNPVPQRAPERPVDFSHVLGTGGITQSLQEMKQQEKQLNEILQRRQSLLDTIIGPFNSYKTAVSDLNVLLAEGKINQDQFNNSLVEQESILLNATQAQTFTEGLTNGFRKMQIESRNAFGKIGEDLSRIFGPDGQLIQGISFATAQAIVFGDSFTRQIHRVAQAILAQLVQAVTQLALTLSLNYLLGGIPGGGGVFKALGFQGGGFTGNRPRNAVAGFVHGQEFVVNADATARNRNLLESINSGGSAKSTQQPVNVSIRNEAPGFVFEQNNISPTDVEIIARRVVRQDAPNVVAGELGNSNSRVSKALTKNTQTIRKRA